MGYGREGAGKARGAGKAGKKIGDRVQEVGLPSAGFPRFSLFPLVSPKNIDHPFLIQNSKLIIQNCFCINRFRRN
jgi:hypothetical protein